MREDAEWLAQLTGLARGLFGDLPPELIARHLLAMIPEPDAQLRRAAVQALSRRHRFAQRDQLAVVERPNDSILGAYRTASAPAKKKQAGPRPYDTVLISLAPLRTSCSCADFVRSALGLCKHGLTVLCALDATQLAATGALAPEPLRWEARLDDPDRLMRLRASIALPGFVPSGNHYRPHIANRLGFVETLQAHPVAREPAVRTLLAEERARAARSEHNRSHAEASLATLTQLARSLYPYQREGVERFFACGRLLLADDIGLGKTTQAVACCHGLFASKRIERGLLIVPLALKAQWRREWQAISDTPLTLVEGTPKERNRAYQRKEGFLLVGYEQLVRDLEGVQRFDPQLVVLDEAQRIKNWATKSAAYVKALSPEYRLVLTGTPLENKLDELASIMDFVDDVALEPKWRLTPAYGIESERGLKGMRNLDQLRARLAPHMLRRVRKDVLAQLPARVDNVVPVPLTEPQQEAHDERKRPIAQLAQRRARRALNGGEFTQLMKLLTQQRMICNGLAQLQFEEHWPRIEHEAPTPALLDGLFAPKLGALRGLIEQIVLGQGRKVVVFSQWRNMLRLAEWAVRDLLAEQGLRAVFFTGAESAAQRDRAVQALHDDASVVVMFLSDAGGVGLNLQRAASCCINLELPWNPAVLEQRIGRIHRLGQSLPIDVYNLVCEDGLEGRIAQLIANKGALFEAVFDGATDEVAFEQGGSFLERIQLEPAADLGDEDQEDELAEVQNAPTAPEAPDDALVSALRARGITLLKNTDGSVRLDAPAEAAPALLAWLEQLAARTD